MTNEYDLDALVVVVPLKTTSLMPVGCCMIQSNLDAHGYSTKLLDLNLQFHIENQDNDNFADLNDYFSIGDEPTWNIGFIPTSDTLNDKLIQNETLSSQFSSLVDSIVQQWADEIIEYNAEYVCISVFSYECQIATKLLTTKLKQSDKWNGKIVVGGAGLTTGEVGGHADNFGEMLLDSELIDYYVRGEGEVAIINVIKHGEGPGINNSNYEQISNLDDIPYANFDDVIDLPYEFVTPGIQIPIVGSRGCVRRCTFCDVYAHWKAYRYRTGEHITNELVSVYDKYGIRDFAFCDSLINGSMKAFREFLRTMVQYYEDNGLPDRFFTFSGHFIVRARHQMLDEDYVMMSRAGCDIMVVGVESGSDAVRAHMKKQFTNEDLDHTIEQFSINGITCNINIMTGYPTETQKDYQDSKDMLTRLKHYSDEGTIHAINLGGTVSIIDGAPLYYSGEYEKIVPSSQMGINWYNPNNMDLTLDERIRRRINIHEHCDALGYNVWASDHVLNALIKNYEKIKNGEY